jgi:hypothetical protein
MESNARKTLTQTWKVDERTGLDIAVSRSIEASMASDATEVEPSSEAVIGASPL